jgi:hypothetical protein
VNSSSVRLVNRIAKKTIHFTLSILFSPAVVERVLGNTGPFVRFPSIREKDVVQLSGGRFTSPGP